jgi:hypothetical protein
MWRALALLSAAAAAAASAAASAASAGATVAAANTTYVARLGRAFSSDALSAPGGLTLSWPGSGVRVSHSGGILRATFAASLSAGFKVAVWHTDSAYLHAEAVVWVPASGRPETVVVSSRAGVVDLLLSSAPEVFEFGPANNATLLSLTSEGGATGGGFAPRPPAPSRVVHVLGDSISTGTNTNGGGPGMACADNGLVADASTVWHSLVCASFNASCQAVAVSGKCLLNECGGTQMQQFYKKQRFSDAGDTFDFDADAAANGPPAAFMVYLGTNDQRVNNVRIYAIHLRTHDSRVTRFLTAARRFYPNVVDAVHVRARGLHVNGHDKLLPWRGDGLPARAWAVRAACARGGARGRRRRGRGARHSRGRR